VAETNEDLLAQVLTNLFSNAIKYSPAGGTITVSAREIMREGKDQPEVMISVQDKGMGMSAEELGKVGKELLYRGEDKGKISQVEGTGIGLYTQGRLLKQKLHGSMAFASEGRGKGTRVTVIIPKTFSRKKVPAAVQNNALPAAFSPGGSGISRIISQSI